MQEDINNPTELIDDKNIALDSKCLERVVACLVKIIHLIHHEDIRNQHQVCELLACEQSPRRLCSQGSEWLTDIHLSSPFP